MTDTAACTGCSTSFSTATRSRTFNVHCKEPLKDFAQRNVCLDLGQRNVPYVVDGCTLSPDDPTNGTVNRPGTDTRFGSNQGLIPLSDLEQLPCNVHDVCYETCGNSQSACDNQFGSDLHAVCAAAYAPPCPWDSAAKCGLYVVERSVCTLAADTYNFAVERFGRGAHESGQVNWCKCCEVPK